MLQACYDSLLKVKKEVYNSLIRCKSLECVLEVVETKCEKNSFLRGVYYNFYA